MFEFSTAKVLQQIPNWEHMLLNENDWAAPIQVPLESMTDDMFDAKQHKTSWGEDFPYYSTKGDVKWRKAGPKQLRREA
eukprot:1844567-Karenia_brevis.AAC.1